MIVPKISVLLPVHNGVPWLAGAIECVLSQTFADFELIIIDDGSKDDSWTVITGFSDPRIRAIRQSNMGLAATLNIGLKLAQAPYVARQDQDDWMHPSRLERQCAFMEENPQCVGVGTWAEILTDDRLTGRFHHHPTRSDALSLFLMFDNPFVHSSMMLRRDAVLSVGGYSEDRERQPPEDYELWSRMAQIGKLHNIGETLTAYREVAGSMSRTGPNPFIQKVIMIGAENIHHALGGTFGMEKCLALTTLYHGASSPQAPISLLDILHMLSRLKSSLSDVSGGGSEQFLTIYRRFYLLLVSQCINRYDVLGMLRIYRRLRRSLSK